MDVSRRWTVGHLPGIFRLGDHQGAVVGILELAKLLTPVMFPIKRILHRQESSHEIPLVMEETRLYLADPRNDLPAWVNCSSLTQ